MNVDTFGRHPDHDRVHFIADKTDAADDGWIECDDCGELIADDGTGRGICAACKQDAADVRRELEAGR